MRVLLDTHVLIWLATMPHKVSKNAKAAIISMDNECLISAVTGWEYGIKRRKHTEQLAAPFNRIMTVSDLTGVDFPFECHKDAEALPDIHRDPFDRMLVAHARFLDCPLVTNDRKLKRYPVEILW